MIDSQNSRINSFDYMRAIACMFVILGHICLVGCTDIKTVSIWVPYVVNEIYPVENVTGNLYATWLIYGATHASLNVGHLGVSIFFLISGFVILRSLDREEIGSFVVRRLFRILPCCAAAITATFALVAAVCQTYSVPNPLTFGDSLVSATLTMNLFHRLPTVPVLWSLEVEVAFYIVMASLASMAGRIDTRRIVIAALTLSNVVFVLLGLSRAPELTPGLADQFAHLSQVLLYMPLMLVGAVTYRCWSDGWQTGSMARVATAVGIFFAIYSSYGSVAGWDGLGVDAIAVTLALLLFACAVMWRRERRWLAPLRFVGAISYPLYLVHAPLGWIVLAAMSHHGFSVHAACSAAILASVLVAWSLHILVERPGQQIGAALSRRLTAGLAAAPALAVEAAVAA